MEWGFELIFIHMFDEATKTALSCTRTLIVLCLNLMHVKTERSMTRTDVDARSYSLCYWWGSLRGECGKSCIPLRLLLILNCALFDGLYLELERFHVTGRRRFHKFSFLWFAYRLTWRECLYCSHTSTWDTMNFKCERIFLLISSLFQCLTRTFQLLRFNHISLSVNWAFSRWLRFRFWIWSDSTWRGAHTSFISVIIFWIISSKRIFLLHLLFVPW